MSGCQTNKKMMCEDQIEKKNVKIYSFPQDYVKTARYFSTLIGLMDTVRVGLCYIQNLHS